MLDELINTTSIIIYSLHRALLFSCILLELTVMIQLATESFIVTADLNLKSKEKVPYLGVLTTNLN